MGCFKWPSGFKHISLNNMQVKFQVHDSYSGEFKSTDYRCDRVSLSVLHSTWLNQVVNHPIVGVSCSIRRWRAGTGRDRAGSQVGSEAESQLVCLKGQEWRFTALWNAVCFRVGVYTGGVLMSGWWRTVPRLRSHHEQSGLQRDDNTQICQHTWTWWLWDDGPMGTKMWRAFLWWLLHHFASLCAHSVFLYGHFDSLRSIYRTLCLCGSFLFIVVLYLDDHFESLWLFLSNCHYASHGGGFGQCTPDPHHCPIGLLSIQCMHTKA